MDMYIYLLPNKEVFNYFTLKKLKSYFNTVFVLPNNKNSYSEF